MASAIDVPTAKVVRTRKPTAKMASLMEEAAANVSRTRKVKTKKALVIENAPVKESQAMASAEVPSENQVDSGKATRTRKPKAKMASEINEVPGKGSHKREVMNKKTSEVKVPPSKVSRARKPTANIPLQIEEASANESQIRKPAAEMALEKEASPQANQVKEPTTEMLPKNDASHKISRTKKPAAKIILELDNSLSKESRARKPKKALDSAQGEPTASTKSDVAIPLAKVSRIRKPTAKMESEIEDAPAKKTRARNPKTNVVAEAEGPPAKVSRIRKPTAKMESEIEDTPAKETRTRNPKANVVAEAEGPPAKVSRIRKPTAKVASEIEDTPAKETRTRNPKANVVAEAEGPPAKVNRIRKPTAKVASEIEDTPAKETRTRNPKANVVAEVEGPPAKVSRIRKPTAKVASEIKDTPAKRTRARNVRAKKTQEIESVSVKESQARGAVTNDTFQSKDSLTRLCKPATVKKPIYMEPVSANSIPAVVEVAEKAPVLDIYDLLLEDEPVNNGKKKRRKRLPRKPATSKPTLFMFNTASKPKASAPVRACMKTNKSCDNRPAPYISVISSPTNTTAVTTDTNAVIPIHPDEDDQGHFIDAPHDYVDAEAETVPEVPSSAVSSAKAYKTPIVPKFGPKVFKGTKVSTPRLGEIMDASETNKSAVPLLKEEVRTCFGFDTESDEEFSQCSDNSCLLGISPVKRSSMMPHYPICSPNYSTASYLSSTATNRVDNPKGVGPQRFLLTLPPNHLALNKNKPSADKARPRPQAKIPLSERNPQQFSSTLCDDSQQKKPATTLPTVVEPPKTLISPVAQAGASSAPKKKQRKQGSKVISPKKTKQTLVYEIVGEEKMVKSRKRIPPQPDACSMFSSDDEDLEADQADAGICGSAEKASATKNTNRTYQRPCLNTSVMPSSPKRSKKEEARMQKWATLQTSHFSEIDHFDLTFQD